MEPRIKHVFPGGNTTVGFYSFYDHILSQDAAIHIFSIKGGPGVGKSSFMKKIAKRFLELGYDVEKHHCSSDPDSLDGVVIPKLKVALLDGTAPHIVDPVNPGAVDEILNFGRFWNEDGIREHRDELVKTNREVSRFFKKGYAYLRAADPIYKSIKKTEEKALNRGMLNLKTDYLKTELFSQYEIKKNTGKERHLFGSAITPKGIINYIESITRDDDDIYIIKDSVGTDTYTLMNELKKSAIIRGFDVECYHSPIEIDKIEDLLIPDLNIFITVSNEFHPISLKAKNTIDLTECLDKTVLSELNDELKEDKVVLNNLIDKAMSYIIKAKKLHDRLEEFYIPNMNFDDINDFLEEIINRILDYNK
ncbi:ATPase [Haloplasma contractile]|uniref:ATPase protein n=1 Tax=Haloplasma contractile SSD-17B TaxID=1033810 RepID=U2EBP6_9MOLU|nr:ATPase [Haloplasma contractile]ERJ12488.1 ATPase protein [Haloplasma contractile SSD-17B]